MEPRKCNEHGNYRRATTQTTVRLQNWSVHTVSLLGSIAETQDILGFEGDVLDAFINGSFPASRCRSRAA